LTRNYARINRKDADDAEPVFIKTWKEARKEGENRLKPHIVAENFRNAVKAYNTETKDTKIPLHDKKQSPLRPKRFRKVFSDACNDAGIPTDIKRIFMGKTDNSNKVYDGKARQDLELYYERVEPNLTIYSEPESINQNLQSQLDDLKQKYDGLIEHWSNPDRKNPKYL
ncbi:MAG: hypothetical protein IIA83_09610, partial [Thaumarchaeota archaeon]|nr:hypothetical protein [Nitrososphaerota archaeon]